MREILKVFGGLTLALAVLFGAGSMSAAPKKGPTGKTRLQCFSDYNDCRIGCSGIVDVDDAISDCQGECSVVLVLCLPPRRVGQLGEDLILEGQADIRGELDRVFTRLTELQSNVTDIKESLAGGQGGSCTAPDLVPLPPLPSRGSPGPELLCQRNDQGQLFVRVHNQGGVSAEASTTRVVFACPNPAAGGCAAPTESNLSTPALDGLADAELGPLDIPAGCFDTGTLKCDFQIGADVESTVSESDEANNNAAGVCGPQIF